MHHGPQSLRSSPLRVACRIAELPGVAPRAGCDKAPPAGRAARPPGAPVTRGSAQRAQVFHGVDEPPPASLGVGPGAAAGRTRQHGEQESPAGSLISSRSRKGRGSTRPARASMATGSSGERTTRNEATTCAITLSSSSAWPGRGGKGPRLQQPHLEERPRLWRRYSSAYSPTASSVRACPPAIPPPASAPPRLVLERMGRDLVLRVAGGPRCP